MQYKKDEVKRKLIEAGEEEFFAYGFRNSSVRRIVKAAGTTIGNFYNYFSNKEELFREVVGSELQKFDEFLNGHEEIDDTEFLLNIQDAASLYKLLKANTSVFIPVFTKRFYILVACSEGTAFADSKGKVQEFIKLHFLGHVVDSGTKIGQPDETADVLAYEFLEGILYIIRKYGSTDKAITLIQNHMLFFLTGTVGILQSQGDV